MQYSHADIRLHNTYFAQLLAFICVCECILTLVGIPVAGRVVAFAGCVYRNIVGNDYYYIHKHTHTHTHLKRASTQTILDDCIRRRRVERILWTDSRLGRTLREERAISNIHRGERARICCGTSARNIHSVVCFSHTFSLYFSSRHGQPNILFVEFPSNVHMSDSFNHNLSFNVYSL